MLDLDALEALYSTMSDNIQGGRWSEAHSNACAIADAAPVLIGELRALRADETMHVEVIGDLMAETTTLKAEIEKSREANRWRPIAEAPKDGTPFEALHRDSGFIRVVGLSELGTFDVFYPLDYFTHYRPIPNLPEGA